MWICLNDAFISAVEAAPGDNLLKIRARNKKHLQTLFPLHRVHTTQNTDYKFRVFATKDELKAVMVARIDAIDYGNFKDSVADKKLHDLYAAFWLEHYRYQNGTPAWLGQREGNWIDDLYPESRPGNREA